MARKAKALRLSELDPSKVAGMTEFRLQATAALLVERLGLGELRRASRDGEGSRPAAAARRLALYAREGLPPDVKPKAGARAMRGECLALAALLWARAIDEGVSAIDPVEGPEGDLADPLTLVLVASWARAELATGGGLTARQLGALAGVDARSVRRFGQELALSADERGRLVATPERATSWLQARGVRGLTEGK